MNKNDILLTAINKFYDEEKNKTILLKILDKSSGISLPQFGMVYHKLR